MTKYNELAQIYRESRQSFRKYEETCATFARELVDGFLDYMEWPRNQEINYLAVGEETDPDNKFFALGKAMQMDMESFWHFGIELRIQEASGLHPISLVLSFFIKKTGPHFIVKLGANGREIKIPESKRGELNPFFDAIYGQIKEFFAKRYIQAITGNEKEFGFITIL
ncbi:MAG: hypothetical protein GY796_16765 [Chloroflexi bacterium]|nr:hypothetical protein [Chloroflexota bacterium]